MLSIVALMDLMVLMALMAIIMVSGTWKWTETVNLTEINWNQDTKWYSLVLFGYYANNEPITSSDLNL